MRTSTRSSRPPVTAWPGSPSIRTRTLLALRRCVDEAWELLNAHLGHEEREAMALVQRHLREQDWEALEREHFRAAYPVRDVVAVVPWAMLGLPGEVREKVLSAAGPPMKVLWWLTRSSFSRREVTAFGGSAPWVTDKDSPPTSGTRTGVAGVQPPTGHLCAGSR